MPITWHPDLAAFPATVAASARWVLQGLPEVLAAMAPCARLYAFLGCSLAKAFPDADHAYSGWIKMYSSREYLVSVDGDCCCFYCLGPYMCSLE